MHEGLRGGSESVQKRKRCLPNHQKSIRFFSRLHMVESPCSKPYKTCRLFRLLGPLLQNGTKKYQKSIRFIGKGWRRVTTSQNIKTVRKTVFWSSRKRQWKYIIKPVDYGDFWDRFCKMALKSIKNALGFSVKVEGVLRLRKTSKTISKTTFWSMQKGLWKYLIKPVVYWPFWRLFGKMPSKVSKSITFFTKSWWRFTIL